MSKGLGQWKNTLNPAQVAEGMNAANQNAKRLLTDAEILFKSGRYPSAISLAILSIEESGKTGILRQLAVAKNGDEVKQAWKAYRLHTQKNASWIFPSLVQAGGSKLNDFLNMYEKDAEHPRLLDNLKQIGFYTDCLGKANWSVPEEVIDEKNTKEIMSVARLLLNKKDTTAREIELWIKHLKPVWNTPEKVVKVALLEWFNEMKAEGLITEGEYSFKDFIGL
ncbi:AbiV family abortive infection protein [Pseudoalteromonas sp. SIMBA_162]|uniref:AbiV family abortive infection protein n=1 Tax=Pseudoalteromonas sp. SIMBA_162 TaxID=3080867 RepID=UPI003978642B|tara:strand:+ start:3727 stop:4395 length:669 start_codon:yes stop_codon:yes gene_type:complete